jgi:hypothetical protein
MLFFPVSSFFQCTVNESLLRVAQLMTTSSLFQNVKQHSDLILDGQNNFQAIPATARTTP